MISIKKQRIRRNIVLLVFLVLIALAVSGTASAEDLSTTGGSTDILNQSAPAGNSQLVDPIIGVKVKYEYANDVINPGIKVKDSNGVNINFTRTYDHAFQGYKVSFDYPGAVNGTKFNLTVSAPGYVTQNQQISVFLNDLNSSDTNLYGHATFNMKATANYKLGREITKKADQLLNFSKADGVLCITTAGLAYRNGTTTEDCLEGILNGSNGKISYGQGNLLTFQSVRTDPLDFCFVVMNGNALNAAYFKNGSLTPAYLGTFSAINQALWDKTIKTTLGKNAFGYVSLANAWKEGLSKDILRQAAYHGHVCLGTISGQAMTSLLLKYYPPGVYGVHGELEATSYRAISVPGNSDDDAFIYSLDLTTGKRSWVGYNTAADNMVGFIRWNPISKLGTLIIMRFNETAVLQKYKQQTGLNAYTGIAGELSFNKWLINKLENDPDSLVEILYVFDNITEEVHNNLTGGADSKNVVCDAKGLDMKYILSLGLNNVANKRVPTTYTTGNLTPEQIKQIGIRAVEEAIKQFKLAGIDLMDYKDSSKLTVFTSAGYVRVNGQVMDMTMDGIYQILGSRLSRATLLPVHNARFNPLYFQFSLENPNGTVTSKTIYYNQESGNLTAKNESACIIDQVILYDPPYDALMAWLWHNHVCGGSSPGYLITNYVYDKFPIGEKESYAFVGDSISCRDDIYSYLLGISPGSGTYFSQRMTSASTGNSIGILSIYDSVTKTRRVAIIDWTGPKFKAGSNSLEEYIRLYKGDLSSPNLISAPTISLTADTWITEEEWNKIISGSDGNALMYLKGLPIRTKEDLIRLQGGSQSGNKNGTATKPAPQGVQGTSEGGSNISTGSIGNSGPTVNAATQVTAEPGSEQGNAYEVSKAIPKSEDSESNILFIIVGAVILGGLLGLGFFKSNLLGFLK